jgi:hypothetical protein
VRLTKDPPVQRAGRAAAANISHKLQKIVADIKECRRANLTRLTVLKKWFETPGRLPSFGVFIASQAILQAKKTTKEESDLFSEVREILSGVDVFMPSIPRAAAAGLYHRLVLFQNVHRDMKFVSVRLIRNQSLFLVEGGLRLYLWPERSDSPTEGYRLAASYCEHYDPRYGNGLNGPSTNRIEEIASFILAFEAHEASNLGA